MNIPLPRPLLSSDFDAKSSASARAREDALRERKEQQSALEKDDYSEQEAEQEAQEPEDIEEITEGEPVLDLTVAPHETDVSEIAPIATELVVANYLGLTEEDEIEEEDIDAEDEAPVSEQQPVKSDAKEEDYAEFERVFVQWKATSDPRLRERLILMNRSMVMFLARRFMDRGELFEDVMQVGMLGLIYALDGYDPARGVKFSTFAIPTISGEIRRYFRDKVSGMRVPRGLQELHSALQIRIEELTQQLDRSPTYAEIAFSLKIEVEQVVEAMELGSAIDPLSIDDRFYGEESATIAESVGAPDPNLHAYEEHAALQAALEKLPSQERRVLELSFFDGHSQAEIARQMNVSQMHISRLMRRSLAQLKQLLEDE